MTGDSDGKKPSTPKYTPNERTGSFSAVIPAGRGAPVNVSNGHSCHRDSKNPLKIVGQLSYTDLGDDEPDRTVYNLDKDHTASKGYMSASNYGQITKNEASFPDGRKTESTSGPQEIKKPGHYEGVGLRRRYVPESSEPYTSIPATAQNNPLAAVGIHCEKDKKPSYPVINYSELEAVMFAPPAQQTPNTKTTTPQGKTPRPR